jgi:hypothetical protein
VLIQNYIKRVFAEIIYFFKRRNLSSKIKRIEKSKRFYPAQIPRSIIRKHKDLWSFYARSVNTRWLKAYIARSGIMSHLYIPEDIYYCEIEPRLNNKSLSIIYTDKNHYDKVFSGIRFPVTILRGMGGLLYDKYYTHLKIDIAAAHLRNYKSFVIKPSINSGGGRYVRIYSGDGTWFAESENKRSLSAEDIIKMYLPDFICQEVIYNHDYYNAFNPTSLNTVRFLLYNSVINGHPEILHAVFRVGKQGSTVDNQAAGGFACGVENEGLLTGLAVNKNGELFRVVNGQSLESAGKLPGFESMRQLALYTGRQIQYSHLFGLDLCLDYKGEPILIEVNCINNEINFFQMANGPLFGIYTDEILKWIRSQKKNVALDFEI